MPAAHASRTKTVMQYPLSEARRLIGTIESRSETRVSPPQSSFLPEPVVLDPTERELFDIMPNLDIFSNVSIVVNNPNDPWERNIKLVWAKEVYLPIENNTLNIAVFLRFSFLASNASPMSQQPRYKALIINPENSRYLAALDSLLSKLDPLITGAQLPEHKKKFQELYRSNINALDHAYMRIWRNVVADVIDRTSLPIYELSDRETWARSMAQRILARTSQYHGDVDLKKFRGRDVSTTNFSMQPLLGFANEDELAFVLKVYGYRYILVMRESKAKNIGNVAFLDLEGLGLVPLAERNEPIEMPKRRTRLFWRVLYVHTHVQNETSYMQRQLPKLLNRYQRSREDFELMSEMRSKAIFLLQAPLLEELVRNDSAELNMLQALLSSQYQGIKVYVVGDDAVISTKAIEFIEAHPRMHRYHAAKLSSGVPVIQFMHEGRAYEHPSQTLPAHLVDQIDGYIIGGFRGQFVEGVKLARNYGDISGQVNRNNIPVIDSASVDSVQWQSRFLESHVIISTSA